MFPPKVAFELGKCSSIRLGKQDFLRFFSCPTNVSVVSWSIITPWSSQMIGWSLRYLSAVIINISCADLKWYYLHNLHSFFELFLPSHVMENSFTKIFNSNEFIFVYVVSIKFICDREICLLTYLTNTTRTFKRKNPTKEETYRTVSILPAISRISERVMQKNWLDL